MAAEVWPGQSIDRRRFVQFLIEFSNQPPFVASVSTPLLVGHLRDDGKTAEAATIKNALLDFVPSRVVTEKDVDRSEDEILRLCPSLQHSYLRRFSYANILYERVRSPFVHEYRPGEKTTSWPMTDYPDARVSYVNWVHDPDRHIFMHTSWLAALTREVGAQAEAEAKTFPRVLPMTWWVDG